jgi:glycosyltransferase involved in cell wall biosynthesis
MDTNNVATPQLAQRSAMLLGRLDDVSHDIARGWAWEAEANSQPVLLKVRNNGEVIGEVLADRHRPDLEAAGIGSGCHGFVFRLPIRLSPELHHVIQVEHALNGQNLSNSPLVLQPHEEHEGRPTDAPRLASAYAWRGRVDTATRDRITGWIRGGPDPDEPVPIQILINGKLVLLTLSNHYRRDLENAGIGNGRHAFDIQIPGGLSASARHIIHVQRGVDGQDLAGSPTILESSDAFDTDLEQAVCRAVAGTTSNVEQERALSFLLEQIDLLRTQRSIADVKRAALRPDQRSAGLRDSSTPTADGTQPVTTRSAPDVERFALVIDDVAPEADRDAGSQAILSHMRMLKRLGYTVSFAAANGMTANSIDSPSQTIEEFIRYRKPYYTSVEDILSRQNNMFDVIYLHRASNASKYLALVRQYCAKACVIYSVADLHHVRLKRQADVELRPDLHGLSRQMRLTEYYAAATADVVITHSVDETAQLRQAVPQANVYTVPWAVPIRKEDIAFSRRKGIAFIGHYGHAPNLDAAYWLAEEVMPLVWQTEPDLECFLVGSAMPAHFSRLTRPSLRPIGFVPDLLEVFRKVRLTVAPLRFGSGVKGKVLESFAAGVPCVMTPVAAEGIDLPHPLDEAVADNAADFSANILRLYANQAELHNCSEAGLNLIRQRFSESYVADALRGAIEGARS